MELTLLFGFYSLICSMLCGICYAPGVVDPAKPSQSPESELSHLSNDGIPALGGVHKVSAEDMDNKMSEQSPKNTARDLDNSFDVLLLTPYWNMDMGMGESLTLDCGVYTDGQEGIIIQWWKDNIQALDSKANSDDRYKNCFGFYHICQ